MLIRQEQSADYNAVFSLIENAFQDEVHSDHREQFLVERLRKSSHFVPELSMVAEIDTEIAGYILLTKIDICSENGNKTPSLALAPVAVLPAFQKQGIGGKLIVEAHKKAQEHGFHSVVLLGHEAYYPKFGYQPLDIWGVKLPFDVPRENAMGIELTPNALANAAGVVEYPSEFFE